MSEEEASQRRRVYTVEQANASLPLVRAITSDIANLSQSILERRERLATLQGNRKTRGDDVYADELAQIDEEVNREIGQLGEYVKELNELGVELKSAPDGLVDFPAEIDGRQVYLCWKLGEPDVLFWHELDSGFSGRQPLAAGTTAGGQDFAGSDDQES